jgi:glycine/D-amino acid oxidase-like deaminating enzyme
MSSTSSSSAAVVRPLWVDAVTPIDRRRLDGRVDADVVVVGAGFTGLWTAYYLLQRDPSLRVVMLEAQRVGDGASGRNGGWCSALLPMGLDAIAAASSHDDAVRLRRAMIDTVAEVGRVCEHESIDCHFAHSGTIEISRNPVQLARARAAVEHGCTYGATDHDLRFLEADEMASIVRATKALGGTFTPHCATVQPALLVHGLARTVEQLGATIYEHSTVTSIEPGRVQTLTGSVVAEVVVRATEAFSPSIPQFRRSVVPIYSLMVATEPLTESMWDEIGLEQRPTFCDGRNMVIYGQRTSDGRLAFGGRGAPYHFRSRTTPAHSDVPQVHAALERTLHDLFPVLDGARITHRWGGAVAAARDWWCSASFDRNTGLASGGGYVGDGVGTSNLIGGHRSDLVSLPFVQHHSRRWEPEPLRWLGINSMVHLTASVDRHEERTGHPATRRSALLSRLTGH